MVASRHFHTLHWTSILLFLLMMATLMSGLKMQVGGLNISLAHLVTFLAIAALLGMALMGRREMKVLFTDNTSILIYLYLGINLASSLWFSDDPEVSMKGCTAIFSYVLVYLVARSVFSMSQVKTTVVNRWLTLNYLSAVFGLGCLAFALLAGGGQNIGVSYEQLAVTGQPITSSTPASIRSLSLEPNLFAVATAALFCISLSVYLQSKSLFTLTGLIILGIAILFAYTRSVYISLVLASGSMLFLGISFERMIRLTLSAVVMVAIAGAILYVQPDTNPVKAGLARRMNSLVDFSQGSGLGRVNTYRIGLRGFAESPFLGKGTLTAQTTSYNQWRGVFEDIAGSKGWLTGVWIQSLHDTGILGFVITMGIFASVILANFRVYQAQDKTTIESAIVRGFLGGNVVLAVSAQLSSSLWIAFPWVFWAINLSYLHWCRTEWRTADENRD